MKFEGSFAVPFEQAMVWRTVTDCAVLERITPAIYSYRVIEPNKQFIADAGIEMAGQALKLSAEIEWRSFIPPEHLQIYATTSWGGQPVQVNGDIWLLDSGETEIRFSAEVTAVHVPKHLLNTLVSNFLKTFFTNFKKELASVSALAANP